MPAYARTPIRHPPYALALGAVLSGLMASQLSDNAQLSAFVGSLGANALTLTLDAALPTASLPNWVAITSGVPLCPTHNTQYMM